MVRGCQTWAPSLQTIAAEFTLRQNAVYEADSCPSIYQRSDDMGQGTSAKKPKRTPGKQANAKGGGGGAYRAYLHLHHAGKRFRAASIQELTASYNNLSDEDKAQYIELGRLGNLAWRHGYAAFGERVRSASQASLADTVPGPGVQQPGGAIVQADLDSRMALIPVATRDFEQDLREIRSRFRASNKQKAQTDQEEETARRQHLEDVLSRTPALDENHPASHVWGAAHSGAQYLDGQLRWFPPCRAFAEAVWEAQGP